MTNSSLYDENRTILENLANPEGFYGQVVDSYMSTVFPVVNQWTVELMDIQAGERVLEIGFGSGLAIQSMVAQGKASRIVGIDHSPLMVEKAKALNQAAIASGQVNLMLGDAASLPDFGQKFHKIVAINAMMYWPEKRQIRILQALRANLLPGGAIYISLYRLYERFAQGGCTEQLNKILKKLNAAGFSGVDGTYQTVTDKQAAIQAGVSICIALHGHNPAFTL